MISFVFVCSSSPNTCIRHFQPAKLYDSATAELANAKRIFEHILASNPTTTPHNTAVLYLLHPSFFALASLWNPCTQKVEVLLKITKMNMMAIKLVAIQTGQAVCLLLFTLRCFAQPCLHRNRSSLTSPSTAPSLSSNCAPSLSLFMCARTNTLTQKNCISLRTGHTAQGTSTWWSPLTHPPSTRHPSQTASANSWINKEAWK